VKLGNLQGIPRAVTIAQALLLLPLSLNKMPDSSTCPDLTGDGVDLLEVTEKSQVYATASKAVEASVAVCTIRTLDITINVELMKQMRRSE